LGDISGRGHLRDAEIMDIDEDTSSEGRLQARLHGYARVPYMRSRVQHAKAGSTTDDEADLDAACREIAQGLESGCVHLFGPGTTTKRILRHAGLEGTLLGVDAVADGRMIGRDLAEDSIMALTEGKPVRIVVGVIGGQGFLFGRGNQQLSASVLRCAGRERITVVASLTKILALDQHQLLVDTGDKGMDAELSGFLRVHTAPDQLVLCRVAA
jgi:predicted polyphosphate/ATP-dependent NAD kinase